MKKERYHQITGTIHLLSGTRIGGSDELLQIGGTDLTCIKHPGTLKPYLPGSSLKGKLRSCLEARQGKSGGAGDKPCDCGRDDCLVCRVFGCLPKNSGNLGPTRIMVRDAQLLSGGEIETKSSTAIDRKSGAALRGSLRSEERVAAGSEFALKIGLQVFDTDTNDKINGKTVADEMIEFVKAGLCEIQNTGLGSGVSKGSGEVEFRDLKLDGEPFNLHCH